MTSTDGEGLEKRHSTLSVNSTSSKFTESVYLIPSPGSDGKRIRRYEEFILRLPLIIGVPLTMFLFGIALEIALFFSNANNGFRLSLPANLSEILKTFSSSAQVLASAIPGFILLPLAQSWKSMDELIRKYHPYVVLQEGNAGAEESLLLDYVALGSVSSIPRALYYKHHIVFWTSVVTFMTLGFQPLTGSIFQIRQVPQDDPIIATQTQSIGLSTDALELNGFMAAASFVDSSVQFGLDDPPFVDKGWATAQITLPAISHLNATLFADTVGVETFVNCFNPIQDPTISPSSSGSSISTLSSVSVDGCTHSRSFNTSVSPQYGVDDVPCPGSASSLDPVFRPVMFWFFNTLNDSSQQVKTVFCRPSIKVFQVRTTLNLNNGVLGNVTGVVDISATSLTNASVFNGVIFDPYSNPLTQIRAEAIRILIPGAILHSAQKLPDGLESTFNSADQFLNLTNILYTRHLSTSAKSVYFVAQNSPLPATIESLLPRLVIAALPAHLLSILLIFVGSVGMVLQINHRKRRNNLLLAAPVGTLASTVALTSRSGFGELLFPYDDEITLKNKLRGLTFRLDQRTGAILADDELTEGEGFSGKEIIPSSPSGIKPSRSSSRTFEAPGVFSNLFKQTDRGNYSSF